MRISGISAIIRDLSHQPKGIRVVRMHTKIEHYLTVMGPEIVKWHRGHEVAFNKAKGSSHNHQAWEGGYRDHLMQCFDLADTLYEFMTNQYGPLPFSFESALTVLYFHDVEKLFKYGQGEEDFDKKHYLSVILPIHGICFTAEELNALQYIHGEGEDYQKHHRTMNELAGFCHAIDTLSARVLHEKKGPIK